MKISARIFSFALFLFACAFAHGQQSYTITGTGCTTPISVGAKATAAFYVTGSWSGTIQPKTAIDGQAAANVQVTPSTSSTAQSTVTASGAYFTNVAGYSYFQVCGATVTGSATIFVNVSRYSH